jgi:hypothetical protein
MAKYATGKYAKAISDRSGMEFPYIEMVREWNGSLVHVSEFEPKQPQLEPKPMNGDAISLRNVRPSRTAPSVIRLIPKDGFETYEAGSRIINVSFPGHGLTNGSTQRFRGPATTSPGTGTPTNAVFAFANPGSFDGITGANIAKAAGYTITTGLYVNDARDTSDYSVANFFHFTVDTDTATKGGVKGGGDGCSVGPITIEP